MFTFLHCRAPRLTGLALRLFVPFMESPFSFPLVAKLMSDSGIPQVCYSGQLLAKRCVLAGLFFIAVMPVPIWHRKYCFLTCWVVTASVKARLCVLNYDFQVYCTTGCAGH